MRSAIRPRSQTIITIADCVSETHSFEIDNVLMGFLYRPSYLIDGVSMNDISEILAGMITAIQSQQFPIGSEIASALRLDLSGAKITTTQSGVVSIIDARLPASTTEVGILAAPTPRKSLDFVFLAPTVPVGPYIDAPLGTGQHIEPSEHGKGLTLAFSIAGFDCGITASARYGVIETLFCAANRSTESRS